MYFTSENNWEINGTIGNSIHSLKFSCNFLPSRRVMYNHLKDLWVSVSPKSSFPIVFSRLSNLDVCLFFFFSSKSKAFFINASKLGKEWWESSYSSRSLFHFSFHLGYWPKVCKNDFVLLFGCSSKKIDRKQGSGNKNYMHLNVHILLYQNYIYAHSFIHI